MTEQGEGLLGSSAIIPRKGSYLHNQRIGLIENLDESKFDRSYLYRLFNTPQVRTHIRATASGTKVRHTAPKRIYSIKVKVPPVTTQRRISETLSAYDDLIENNRQRIALLEEAARILYREWFVRFRFPGHEHVKTIDGIPVDWKVKPIAKVCTTYDDGDWLETKDQGGVDYRIIQISNIGDNCFTETANGRYITEETVRRLNCHEVLPGDILVSRMPRPIGRGWMVLEMPFRMVTAVDVTIVRANLTQVVPYYLLHHINSDQNIAHCEANATGTTRPRISRKSMGQLPIILPPLTLQRQFSDFAEENNRLRASLFAQNEKLTQARDLLLPRLMNGEITV
jgi:type I restriction enzyme S subunit